jgi:hypothetical protein
MPKSILSFEVDSSLLLRLDDACEYLKDDKNDHPMSRSELLRKMLLRYLNQDIEPAMKADNWFNNRRSVQEILNGPT